MIYQQVDEARGKLSEAQIKAKEYQERTGKSMNQAIDKFDETVEKKTSEAKSGVSSWFGGK
jgi:vacuolar-type H+-ATPase subunit H